MSLMSTPSTTQNNISEPCPAPRRFLRVRTILLGSIFFTSFVWVILLCVALFCQWNNMGVVERTLIFIMLFVNFITTVMIPLLLAQDFRMWLDAARCLFLFASHFGMAVWFVCRNSSFDCPTGVNEHTICSLLITSIVIASWIIPVLVLSYACGLVYLQYRLSNTTSTTPPPTAIMVDIEKHQKVDGHRSVQWSHRSYGSYGYPVL